MGRTYTTLQRLEIASQATSIINLKVQVGQISNMLNARPHMSLPSNTEINTKEHVKDITLQRGK